MKVALDRRGGAGVDRWFKHSVCLNLDRRPERWARMQKRFAKHGISGVARFSAIDGAQIEVPPRWGGTPGAYGCLLSNLAVVEHARDEHWPDVLLFEDDVVFHDEFDVELPRFMAQLPSDWDMVFFGGMHREGPLRVRENVLKLTGSTSTYAYAVRSTVYDAFLEAHAGSCEPIDVRNRQLQEQFNCYCAFPHLASVDGGQSDTQGRPVNPWWLRDSLILGGAAVDDQLSRTLIVIPYADGPNAELSRRNLAYIADAYRRLLCHAALAIVWQGSTLDGTLAPPGCQHLILASDGHFDAGRCGNEAVARFGRDKDFYVFAGQDVVPTWDTRAHLVKCFEHDLASSAHELIDLTEEDSSRLVSRRHHTGTEYPLRPRRGICAEGCVVTRHGFEKSGGWRENRGTDGAPLSLRRLGGVSVFDSPALAMRLFAGADQAGGGGRAC